MKIAFIYDAVYPWIKGGAEKRVYEIAKRLSERGHEVHWYSVGWWVDDQPLYMEKEGIIFHGVCQPVDLYKDGTRTIKEALYFAWKLAPVIMKEDFDIIDCQEFPYFPCFVAKIHSIFKKSVLLITWYEVWDKYWYDYIGKKGFFGRIIEKTTTKLPKKIIPISNKIKDDLKIFKVPEEKNYVIPNGVDFNYIQSIKPRARNFDIIYVGRLISHKNVDVLLRAISKVKKTIPNIRCGIIGSGPDLEKLENLSKILKLEDNVNFFGFVEKDEDVYSHMKSSKIFVLPSTREGFPNTILEANSCGLPAIIVNHEKNAGVGVIKDNENGFIVNLSAEDISNKILYLLENEIELTKLNKKSISFAKNYDWELIVSKIEKLYEATLNET